MYVEMDVELDVDVADEQEQDQQDQQDQKEEKTEYSDKSEESEEEEEVCPVFTNPAISQSAPISLDHMDGEVETDDSNSSDEESEKETTSPLHLSSIFHLI